MLIPMCFSPSSNSSRRLLSLQETHITHTLTALHNMSKIQCRQLKSVKIPWDKQGFLKKKKKKIRTAKDTIDKMKKQPTK